MNSTTFKFYMSVLPTNISPIRYSFDIAKNETWKVCPLFLYKSPRLVLQMAVQLTKSFLSFGLLLFLLVTYPLFLSNFCPALILLVHGAPLLAYRWREGGGSWISEGQVSC